MGQFRPDIRAISRLVADIVGYDPLESAKNINKPFLNLLGTHDLGFIPNAEALNLWKSATQNNPKADYMLYPGLNHFLIETDTTGGDSLGYGMDEGALTDIADFINNQYR